MIDFVSEIGKLDQNCYLKAIQTNERNELLDRDTAGGLKNYESIISRDPRSHRDTRYTPMDTGYRRNSSTRIRFHGVFHLSSKGHRNHPKRIQYFFV